MIAVSPFDVLMVADWIYKKNSAVVSSSRCNIDATVGQYFPQVAINLSTELRPAGIMYLHNYLIMRRCQIRNDLSAVYQPGAYAGFLKGGAQL